MALWPRQLVKVRAGNRGSGWAVGHSGVLTALHVVRPHLDNPYQSETNADGVRCLAVSGGPAGEVFFECAVVWLDEAADLALLQIAEGSRDVWRARLIDEAPTVLAAPGAEDLSDTDPLRNVSAIGFPDAALAADANRPDPDQLAGTLLPSSGVPGRISVDVSTSTPEGYPLWRGLSGAAVREPGSGRLLAIVVQAVPGRAASRLYVSQLPDPDTDRGWAAALAQVGAVPVLEDRHAPEARRFLTSYDPAGRPWQVGRVPQLADFGVRRARDDLAPPSQPYFPFVGRPEVAIVEAALNDALANAAAPRIVMLAGESAAGKSRLAAEVVTRMAALAEYRFIRPAPAQRIGDLPEVFRRGRVLLWLDDLHRYLASDLDAHQARALLKNRQLVIVATVLRASLRALDQSGFKTGATDLVADKALVARIDIDESATWSVDGGADPAEARVVREALAKAGHAGVGLGEYLAAYAELRDSYRNAGPWTRGLIDCVADWRRAGVSPAMPEPRARDLWRAHYLPAVHAPQWQRMTDEDRESTYLQARQEAVQPALGSTALLALTRGGLAPSDVAVLERQRVAVPDEMWAAAAQVAVADPAQAESVAVEAARAGQFQIAERLWMSLSDREPRAVLNLGLMRVNPLVRPYLRMARDAPQNLVPTASSMIGEVVGRDALCDVIIEDLRDRGMRRPHMVVGGVGAGKTALLVQLTRLLAERGTIPVPIRLRDAQGSLDFRELARQRFVTVTNTWLPSDADGDKVWRELCKNDQVVVLADGLEEALIEGDRQDGRDDLIQLTIRQAGWQRLPLVVTSQPHDSLGGAEAAIVELEPLGEDAALEYIQPGGSGEDSRRLGWIVEAADVGETPLYLQITRDLYVNSLLEPSSAGQRGVVDTRGADRSRLRLALLQTWERALISGHLYEDVPLNQAERQAAVEHISALACIGLKHNRRDVEFDDFADGRISAEVRRRLMRIGKQAGRTTGVGTVDARLAAAWAAQLELVELRGDGVRFQDSILQAYLASRVIDVAMADSAFRDQALAKSGHELLMALVLHSRARSQTPRSDGTARGSRHAAQPGTVERTLPEYLCEEASGRTDVKALDLYAAALQVDSVEKQPAHDEIAEKLKESWPGIRARDQRTLEAAKLNVVRQFGEAARAISERRRGGEECPAEPGYLHLYRIGCSESSYPIQLACVEEIGAGGDEAFDALADALGPPLAGRSDEQPTAGSGGRGAADSTSAPQACDLGPEEDQQRQHDVWKEGAVRAWLAPLLAGSATERNSPGAKTNLEQWLRYIGEPTRTKAESDLRLSLEIALAQGFKHAANRRRRHPHARPEARAYLAEQTAGMLRESQFWFTRLTLVHSLCLWSLLDERTTRRDRVRRGYRALIRRWMPYRRYGWRYPDRVNYRTLIRHWVAYPGSRPEHPFVVEAGSLAVLALETGQPERFIWIDERGVATRVGSGSANPGAPHKHNLWIPPSTGWAALHPQAQQLLADVLLLLNLAERGARPGEHNWRLLRTDRHDLPPCLAGDRSPLDPTRTAGMAETSQPGSNCQDGCPFGLCPYPPKGEASDLVELSEAFCRRQPSPSGGRTAPWQETRTGDLRQFWKQMRQRARSVERG